MTEKHRKLTEEAYQFINDRPESLNDDLYQWAVDAEIIIGDLCKALSAAQPEREPLSDLELAEMHYGEGYAEYVGLDVFVDIAREVENYYGITANKEQS